MNTKEKRIKIRKVSLLGITVNLFLFIIKSGIGLLGGSYSVVADGFHSLSDGLTDLAIFIGIKYWDAPPDQKHPYGHKRIETLITFFIGMVIILVSLGILYSSIKGGFDRYIKEFSGYVLIGPLLSIVLKEILFHKTIKIGRDTKSQSVVANAWHHRSDAISSIPPIMAIIMTNIKPEFRFLDQVAAIIISVFMLKVAYNIIKKPFMELCGRGLSEREIKSIRNLIEEEADVREVHKIRTRQIGGEVFVDLHMLVDADKTVKAAHDIAENMQLKVIRSFPSVVDVVIHIEPY